MKYSIQGMHHYTFEGLFNHISYCFIDLYLDFTVRVVIIEVHFFLHFFSFDFFPL